MGPYILLMKKYILAIIIVILVAAFFVWLNGSTDNQVLDQDYKNITYKIEGQEVNLVNGEAHLEIGPGMDSEIEYIYLGYEARGDLNNDKKEDVAFILNEESSGTGVFFHGLVALKTSSGYEGLNSVSLGDRISPKRVEIKNGEVIFAYLERKEDEPMTAEPSVPVTKKFKLVEGKLTEM